MDSDRKRDRETNKIQKGDRKRRRESVTAANENISKRLRLESSYTGRQYPIYEKTN